MRLNFTSLLIAVVLTLFGATTAQAQTFVTYAEQSTPASEIETGLYVIKAKYKTDLERYLYVSNGSQAKFSRSVNVNNLQNVWRVEKRTDGSFYMMNMGTGAYLKLAKNLSSEATDADNGGRITITNGTSSASYFSARPDFTHSVDKMDENAFAISAGAPTLTGVRQYLHANSIGDDANIGMSSWSTTVGGENVGSSTAGQFAFYKVSLDYSALQQTVPTLSEGCLYYIQAQNGIYISNTTSSAGYGLCTNDVNSARKFCIKKKDDNRYEIFTEGTSRHTTISDYVWFVPNTQNEGGKEYFGINPVSGTDYFTINNITVNSDNTGSLQYILVAASGSAISHGNNNVTEVSYWKFVPANDAATAAASLTANVQTGDAVHGNVTTFSASYPVAIPTGYKAYTANYDNSQNVINVTELAGNVIPANTGVLLRGDVNASLSMKPTMQTGTAVTGNVLTAVGDAAKTFESTDDKIYLLGKQDGTLCFRHMSTNGTQTIAAHKAYINLSGLSTAELSTLRIRFDGETTGINEVPTTTTEGIDNGIYDLSGRRVSQPTHGIYIKGGKKVIL